MRYHFYPRSPCGERRLISDEVNANNVISSTLSLRRATPGSLARSRRRLDFIHALLAESDGFYADMMALTAISIHALPCGERPCSTSRSRASSTISIHALLAESDFALALNLAHVGDFIHALLAESDSSACCGVRRKYISIHALLAESDSKHLCVRLSIEVFLSTLSLRRATVLVWCSSGGVSDFYPRSPCGERHSGYDGLSKVTVFLSTLSLRRATQVSCGFRHPK